MTKIIVLFVIAISVSGCAANTYHYGTGENGNSNTLSPPMQQQILIGAPHKFLDASDWYWPGSLLSKLVLWNKSIDSHEISDDTIAEMAEYIDKNDLADVQVLINTYKPGTQWRRLFKNREVSAGWRYTLGILSASIHTVLPGRFFGGDHYNPYTNTISIYSNNVAVALHEASHAKDFNSRKLKGTHAAIYALPGAPLFYEAVASNDALSYLKHECRYDEQKRAYRMLHPAYGTYVGGFFLRESGLGFLGAIPGHITGAIAAMRVRDDAYSADSECR